MRAPNRIILCRNCLTDEGVEPFSVGPDQGNQFDSYRTQLDLCEYCRNCLLQGNLSQFASRNKRERTYRVHV